MPGSSSQVTELLVRWRGGDREALDSLLPLVYDELRRIARHYLQGERPGHTLQSTALVNEAYVRTGFSAVAEPRSLLRRGSATYEADSGGPRSHPSCLEARRRRL